jgi:ubiquinol-cytochrome c reductase cytochrome b subunit
VVAVPLALVGLVVAHIIALHHVGSNNPEGVEIKKYKDETGRPLDGIPFHPYYTVKDLVGIVVFLFIASVVIFFIPEMGGYFLEHANFVAADPLKTPEHIAPVWYFTPYYAILRAIPDKLLGVIGMGASIAVLFLLPWLDRCPVKSIHYRSFTWKVALTLFVISFLILGYAGAQPPSDTLTLVARICSVIYFGFFLLMPFYTYNEKTKPVPDRVSFEEVTVKNAGEAKSAVPFGEVDKARMTAK